MILVTDVLMGAHPSKCSWKLVAKSWMTKDIDIDWVNKICYTLMMIQTCLVVLNSPCLPSRRNYGTMKNTGSLDHKSKEARKPIDVP